MAPRETRVEGMNFGLLRADQAERLLDSLAQNQASQYAPPKATSAAKNPELAEAASQPPVSQVADLGPADQAAVLKAAAAEGIPFCEECAKPTTPAPG